MKTIHPDLTVDLAMDNFQEVVSQCYNTRLLAFIKLLNLNPSSTGPLSRGLGSAPERQMQADDGIEKVVTGANLEPSKSPATVFPAPGPRASSTSRREGRAAQRPSQGHCCIKAGYP